MFEEQSSLNEKVKKLRLDQDKEIDTIKENFIDINKKFHSLSLEISANIHRIEKKIDAIFHDRLVNFEKGIKDDVINMLDESASSSLAKISKLEENRSESESIVKELIDFPKEANEKFNTISREIKIYEGSVETLIRSLSYYLLLYLFIFQKTKKGSKIWSLNKRHMKDKLMIIKYLFVRA